jgi:hypothetical protein
MCKCVDCYHLVQDRFLRWAREKDNELSDTIKTAIYSIPVRRLSSAQGKLYFMYTVIFNYDTSDVVDLASH